MNEALLMQWLELISGQLEVTNERLGRIIEILEEVHDLE